MNGYDFYFPCKPPIDKGCTSTIQSCQMHDLRSVLLRLNFLRVWIFLNPYCWKTPIPGYTSSRSLERGWFTRSNQRAQYYGHSIAMNQSKLYVETRDL